MMGRATRNLTGSHRPLEMNFFQKIIPWICLLGLTALHSGCKPSNDTAGDQNDSFLITTASGIPMVFVPAGSFVMGSNEQGPDEGPTHEVTLNAFLIDQFEVTHDQMERLQLPNPSHWQDDPRKPVEQIRWRDAKLFCNERSLAEGLEPCYDESIAGWPCDPQAGGYRLPSEAEWEYAARAGSKQAYPEGIQRLKTHAWHGENADSRTHVVGTRRPNAWGIHDMYGNVSEWCQDVYQSDYYTLSPSSNPRGPTESPEQTRRSMRGGSWKSSPQMCRVTFRQGQQTGDSDACFFTDFCGFRCVRTITLEEASNLQSATSTKGSAQEP